MKKLKVNREDEIKTSYHKNINSCYCIGYYYFLLSYNIKIKADVGPKSYVRIKINNVSESKYFATLISKNTGSSRWQYYDGSSGNDPNKGSNPEIWDKFQNYVDSDNFYFLGYYRELSQNDTFSWTLPPNTFKLLMYFPDHDKFIVSEIYTVYAFGSNYIFDLNKVSNANGDVTNVNEPITLEKNYIVLNWLKNFAIRLALTIAIELVVALAFLFFSARKIVTIFLANIITQIFLNLFLSLWLKAFNFSNAMIVVFILLELGIIAVEGFIYHFVFKNEAKENDKVWLIYLYAVIANLLSVGLGILLVNVL